MLEKSLSNPHPVVRIKGIEAAARLESAAVVPLILPLLADPDARARSTAIATFARLASAAHEAEIGQFSLSASPGDLAAFLGELRGRTRPASLWISVLRSRCASLLRVAAVAALASADDLLAMQTIFEAAADEDAAVRGAAEEVLRSRYEWVRSGAAEEALPALEHARAHGSAAVQQAASAWAERIRAAQLRRKMVESGVASVIAVTTALRSRIPAMRQGAAEACVTLRDTRATAALVQCLQDSDSNVRHAVAAALCKLGWEAETLEQHAAILAALGRFEAACELGPSGLDAVAVVLPISDPKIQISAIETLSQTQSLRVMNPLASLLESSAAEVRRAAAAGLRKLEWVPTNRPQALKYALALEDWAAAAEHGAPAVAPLFSALKAARPVPERFAAIEAALCSMRDGGAADPLLGFCRDGEVAAVALQAAIALVGHSAATIPPQALQQMADFPDVVQFTVAVDARSGQLVRTGLDTVSAERLRVAASSKLAGPQTPIASSQKFVPS